MQGKKFIDYKIDYKKSQGANAAILVAVVGLLIVLYILFLPAAEREELLENKTKTTAKAEKLDEDVLLLENPGKMFASGKKEREYDLEAINLNAEAEATVLREMQSVYAKNSLFDRKTATIDFALKENAKNALLSFKVKKAKGTILVKLNGKEVYQGILEVNALPITLPEGFLAANNVVSFEVSSVGIRFWSKNEYILEDVKVIADILAEEALESAISFFLADDDANIKEAILKFSPECNEKEVGPLTITINNNRLFSAIPDCGSFFVKEFSPDNLLGGENKLTFSTAKGRYLIDRINIDTKLREVPSYVFYFDISEKQLDDIQKDRKDLNMTLVFVDDDEDKEAEFIANGKKFYLQRTDDIVYIKNLESYAEKGSNSLKIIPKVDLDVRELRVELLNDRKAKRTY